MESKILRIIFILTILIPSCISENLFSWRSLSSKPPLTCTFIIPRGGFSNLATEDEYNDEYETDLEVIDEYDDEFEPEVDDAELSKEKIIDDFLVKSTVASRKKHEAKQTKESKTAVSKLLKKKLKKKWKMRLPYIVRASLNPFTLLAMTKAYFGSLFNISYLEEDNSKSLRSALETKAKRNGVSSKQKKKAMKRGQAKTLSDLPQLSA